jgi:hypothetical protein
MYALNSAWFAFDEPKRGSLQGGKYADLAVLSDDYLTVPVEKVGELHSVLTMVGGKVVWRRVVRGAGGEVENRRTPDRLSTNRGARDGDRGAARPTFWSQNNPFWRFLRVMHDFGARAP